MPYKKSKHKQKKYSIVPRQNLANVHFGFKGK